MEGSGRGGFDFRILDQNISEQRSLESQFTRGSGSSLAQYSLECLSFVQDAFSNSTLDAVAANIDVEVQQQAMVLTSWHYVALAWSSRCLFSA